MKGRKTDRRSGNRRPNAFRTDIARTITGNLKRFISLFVITALGATMLVGLKAACDDLRFTADSYYDSQRLFDISIQSTLGLDEGDIEALAKIDGVDVVEGGYSETAYTQVKGASAKVDLKALLPAGMNEPQVIEGRLPRDVNEAAVTQKYLDVSGKKIGDTVTFEGEGEEPSAAGATDDAGEAGDDAGAAGAAVTADATGTADAADDTALAAGGSSAIFKRGEYTITASVLDPMDVNAGSKTMSFRSSGGSQYAFFLTPGAVLDRGTFTVAYLTVKGAADLMTYSDEYKDMVDEVKQRVEDIREQREEARSEGLKADARKEVDDAQAEADKQFEDAQAQIDDALAQIAEGEAALAAQGADARRQLADAQTKLDASRTQLTSGMAVIDARQTELDAGRVQAESALAQIAQAESGAATLKAIMNSGLTGHTWPEAAWQRLLEGDATAKAEFTTAITAYIDEASGQLQQAEELCDGIVAALDRLPVGDPAAKEEALAALDRLAAIRPDLSGQIEQIKALVSAYPESESDIQEAKNRVLAIKNTLTTLSGQLFDMSSQADGIADAVLSKPTAQAALSQIEAGQVQLDAARAKANQGLGQLEAARATLDQQRASAEAQLEGGRAELAEGSADAAEGQAELDEQKASANAKFADARSEVDGIERATWYIQDRSSLASYASIESDASSIESIATVFPLIFFTVAVLISLTTVTRMVEEDRGLIGVYKALGYSRGRILSKYLIYSFAACVAGGIAGDALGFIVLPEIIFTIFTTMYALPPFQLHFNAFTAALGITLFAVGIVGATFLACRHVLRETPASLMRPKAPRAGKRILLERITPVWRRLSFLNKVSARNLFRYKKRFLMTVFGIAGCTALMICGLGIRDTVISLKPRQYGSEGIVRYDLLAVTADADFSQGEDELRATGAIDTMLEARVDTVTAEFGGVKENIQLIVVPDNADLSAYMKTEDGSHTSFLAPAMGGEELGLPREDNGALITKNAEQVLGFGLGDELALQGTALQTGSARVDGITVNFLGNFIFMTESAYQEAFGEPCIPNAFLVSLEGTDAEKIALADELSAGNTFVSVSSSTKIANDFSESFKIIDVVVYVVTVMAAALAFAVVFTLSNTNISERERELATIKVLGFRRREVYRYINKETIVLTLIGIVAGWPLGYLITRFLTYVLRMPSLFFDTIVEPQTYVFASIMALVFTLIINQMTNRSLDKIDMVGALKSAE